MITYGDGKFKVWCKRVELDEDLVYVVGGGEKSHVGSIAIMVPGEKCNVIARKGHHDHEVIQPIAEGICEKYGQTVVVVGGIHIDDASEDDIETIKKNCEELIKCI
jgi:hypothetical protein